MKEIRKVVQKVSREQESAAGGGGIGGDGGGVGGGVRTGTKTIYRAALWLLHGIRGISACYIQEGREDGYSWDL